MFRLASLLSLLVILNLSCNSFKIPEYKDFQNLRLESLGLNETTVYMELLYNNPNRIGFQVNHTEADVYVDDVYLGRAVSDTLIKVARKSDFIIPLRIKTDMKNIFKNAWSAISSKEVTVRASGTIRAGVGGLFKTIPLSYEGKHQVGMFEPRP
ncbi:MAG: LEA type 2 family protein [Lacibacter sp.]